jgi:hypothetical protein
MTMYAQAYDMLFFSAMPSHKRPLFTSSLDGSVS